MMILSLNTIQAIPDLKKSWRSQAQAMSSPARCANDEPVCRLRRPMQDPDARMNTAASRNLAWSGRL